MVLRRKPKHIHTFKWLNNYKQTVAVNKKKSFKRRTVTIICNNTKKSDICFRHCIFVFKQVFCNKESIIGLNN